MPDRCDRESGVPLAPEVKTNEGHKAARGDLAEHVGDGLGDQTRLSILSWNAGLKRGRVTNSVVGSYHVILLQAEWHFYEVTEIAAEHFRIYQGADQLLMLHKNTFKLGDVNIEGTPEQDSFGLKHLMLRPTFRRAPKQGERTYTPASVRLSNTTAMRRGIAKRLLGQFTEAAELRDVDTVGSDFNTSAFREGGKVRLSSVEDVWEEMRPIPPRDLVPMWRQMEDSGDRCCFVFTNSSVFHWRAARHGSLHLNRDKMQIRVTDQGAHLPVFAHLCEIHTTERSARSEAGKENRRKRGEERRREKEEATSTCALKSPTCGGCCDAGRTYGPGKMSSGPSMAFPISALTLAALPRPSVCLESIRNARCPAVCSFPPVSKSSSSSHVPWQGSTRWQGWSGAWKGWDDSSATVSPVQNPEQISDERATTVLHTMQDRLQQTTVIAQRRSQNMISEQSMEKQRQCSLSGHGGPHPSA